MAKRAKFAAFAGAVAALSLGGTTTAAAAATLDFAPASVSKSYAILGGPSHLAQILADQRAGSASAAVIAPQPASYSLPRLSNGNPWAEDAVRNGNPDVFGTVALRVNRTPLDWRWRSVANSGVTGAAAAYARSLRGLDSAEAAQRINSYVNRHVTYTEDMVQYGREDVWAPADQTLRRGRGDCEDYAIAKLQMLKEAGFSARDLYLVLVKDLVRRADHAVLVVRTGDRLLLLDDGTDRVLDTHTVSDYRPVLTFASYGTWTHGYVRPDSGTQVANSDVTAEISPASAQRSLNASLFALNTGISR
jgi:predicted transglutaminase-like cysteine proteinase